jgi:uncharacterized membrane protein
VIIFVLKYLFLFTTGGLFGWLLEVFYRRYFGGAKQWINPGFLSGPFLPLYGTGVCLLYIVSDMHLEFWIKVLMFTLVTTFIEYVTGEFFLRYYKTRLWDYSDLKVHFRGIISPLYSVYWTVLSLFFYFVLYPYFYNQIDYLYRNLELSLFVGIALGVLGVDMMNSFDIINRLKHFAEAGEERVIIDYEQLKLEIREKIDSLSDRIESVNEGLEHRVDELEDRVLSVRKTLIKRKPTFLRPFNGSYELMTELKRHIELRNKFRKKR